MNPPNPLTIEWLRENAKPGETVLHSTRHKEDYLLTGLGRKAALLAVLNDCFADEEAWGEAELHSGEMKLKQPAKPKACAFVSDLGVLEYLIMDSEQYREREKYDNWKRAHQYDIEPRE